MEDIYRDPLFGVAVLIAIIALIVLADYFRNFYRKRQKEKSLKALVKSYEHNGFFDGIAEFLQVSKDPIPTLLFLAKSYVIQGDNQQAIKIYLTLIDQIQEPRQKIEVLEELANAYFYSGFLHKAQDLYLEVLKNFPRNIKVLSKLVELYETLGEYQKALNAVECMEELLEDPLLEHKEKLALLSSYLNMKILTQDFVLDEDKQKKLCLILKDFPQLVKPILSYFKLCNPKVFWEYLPQEGWEDYIDLLWDFLPEQIPLKDLKHSKAFEVFVAKGYYPSSGCSNFVLETLRLFNQNSKMRATLNFSYQCQECHHKFPFDNFRCPNCGELGSMKLLIKPQRQQNETNFSLL